MTNDPDDDHRLFAATLELAATRRLCEAERVRFTHSPRFLHVSGNGVGYNTYEEKFWGRTLYRPDPEQR